jgi:DNA-binding NarL/FixJ family response regulator
MGQEAPIGVVLVGAGPHHAGTVLDGDGFVLLGLAPDPAAAVVTVRDAAPHVVVVDLDTGPAAALAAVAELAALAPDVPILAVSAAADHAEVLAAVRAGAAGYLVGGGGLAELVHAVRRTAAGEAVFSPGLAEVVLEAHGRSSAPAAAPARLTEREADVLRLVVEGLTARQIATRLVLSPRTVENHVQHVLRKLELNNRAALVRYAIENGLA